MNTNAASPLISEHLLLLLGGLNFILGNSGNVWNYLEQGGQTSRFWIFSCVRILADFNSFSKQSHIYRNISIHCIYITSCTIQVHISCAEAQVSSVSTKLWSQAKQARTIWNLQHYCESILTYQSDFVLFSQRFRGRARTQSPTIRNYAVEIPTFEEFAKVNKADSAMAKSHFERTTFMIIVSLLPGKYDQLSRLAEGNLVTSEPRWWCPTWKDAIVNVRVYRSLKQATLRKGIAGHT